MSDSIRIRQARLLKMSIRLADDESLSPEDRQFLAGALRSISSGADAKEALDVKAKRGERTSKASQQAQVNAVNRKRMVCSWMFVAMQPIEKDGQGKRFEEAAGEIGEEKLNAFGLTEETIKTYWNRNPELRHAFFTLTD